MSAVVTTACAVPETYVINLKRDTDRRRAISRQFERAGIPFICEPAVNGSEVPEHLAGYFFDGRPQSLKDGEIGCYASHLAIMHRMVRCGTPLALVCEDDIVIEADFAAIIGEVLVKAPVGWDIIRLSSPPKRAVVPVTSLSGGRCIALYSRNTSKTGAYLITRQGARKFLRTELRSRPVDDDMKRTWHFGHEMYGVVPPPVTQPINRPSTIMDMGGRTARRKSFRAADVEDIVARTAHNIRTLGFANWLWCMHQNMLRLARKMLGTANATTAGPHVERA